MKPHFLLNIADSSVGSSQQPAQSRQLVLDLKCGLKINRDDDLVERALDLANNKMANAEAKGRVSGINDPGSRFIPEDAFGSNRRKESFALFFPEWSATLFARRSFQKSQTRSRARREPRERFWSE